MSAGRLRLAKGVVGAIIGIDLVVLAAFSFHPTKTTATTTAATVVAPQAPSVVPGAEQPPQVPADDPALGDATDLATQTQQVADTTPATTPTTKPSATPTPSPSTTPDDDGAVDGVTLASCPADLPEPASTGGLQSLISLAPAFGPFKDEAFGLGPVYQPILTILGPLLAQYPQHEDELKPAVDAFVSVTTTLVDSGWAIIGPLYSPYRNQFLAAEQQLSDALAPITRGVASSSLSGCLRSLQAILLNDVKEG